MVNNTQQKPVLAIEKRSAEDFAHALTFRHTYHEIGERHVIELDVLEQLKSNINQLEDLHGRLKYMMGELQGLLKK